MPAVRLPPVHRPRPTVDVAWRIFDDLVGSGAPDFVRRTFALGLLTGARTGELLQVLVGDIDLEGRRVEIRSGKTGARSVFLAAEAAPLLLQEIAGRRADERFVGERAPASIAKATTLAIRLSARKQGFAEFTIYGLRRLAVDEYHRAGCPAPVAGAQLGHSAEVAARIYRQVRWDEQSKVAQVARIGVRPAPLPVPPPPPQVSPASALHAAGSTAANQPVPGTNPAGASKNEPGVLHRAEGVRRIEADKTIKVTFGGSR
jgi:integrase